MDAVRLAIGIFDGDLGLAVGAQPGQNTGLPHFGQSPRQFVRIIDGHGHQGRRLVAGKAEHHPLVARADGLDLSVGHAAVFGFHRPVHAQRDVGALRGNGKLDGAGVAVETLVAAVETDIADHLAHQIIEVHKAGSRDLAHQHHKPGLGERLARHARARVLGKERVQHSVANLIAHLVGVAFRHRFTGEQKAG